MANAMINKNLTRVVSLVLLAFALLVSTANPSTAIEGGKVLDGVEGRPHAPDWAVAIIDKPGAGLPVGNQTVCSGSLITPTKVLTAAHCLYEDVDDDGVDEKLSAINFKVSIGRGDLDRKDQGVEREVNYALVHLNYDRSRDKRFDLAILSIDAVPSDFEIMPISRHLPRDGMAVNAYGYGTVSDDGDQSRELQKTPDLFYRVVACEGSGLAFCVQRQNSSVNVHRGDSGGPWVARQDGALVQYLVHQGGFNPEQATATAGVSPEFPDVDHYDWIKNRANLFNVQAETIVRNPATADAWLVGEDGKRRRVPDGGTYLCLVDQGHSVQNASLQQIQQIPEARDEVASCGASGQAAVSTALVVDSSGSMTSSDPQNQRLDAARAYLASSLSEDEVSLVDFDGGAQVLSEAVPVGANRNALREGIESIDSSGNTDLGAGLQAGCDTLRGADGASRAAIFFTDGDGSYSDEASCFADAGWKVFTIGLGSAVDEALLEQIASQTGGTYRQLGEATNLVCEFQQVRAQIVGNAPQSCEPTGIIELNETIEFFKQILTNVAQMTFTNSWNGSDTEMTLTTKSGREINRSIEAPDVVNGSDIEMTLTTPSGREIDRSTGAPDVVSETGETFETITVSAPEPGQWRVELFGADIPESGEPFNFSTVEIEGETSEQVPAAEPVDVSVDAGPTPSRPGQETMLTATVTPATPCEICNRPAPSGTVSFNAIGPDGSNDALGTATLNGTSDESATAELNAQLGSAGTYEVIGTYLGDDAYATGASSVSQEVARTITTETSLVAQPKEARRGDPVSLTASVRGADGPITRGTVSFQDGGEQLGHAEVDAAGEATFVATDLGVGGHTLTATYEGAAGVTGSTSGEVQVIVGENQVRVFVDRAYEVAYGRAPTESERSAATALLREAGDARSFLESLTSDEEGRRNLVEYYYGPYLNREADQGGVDYWTDRLVGGLSPLKFQAQVLASAEFHSVFGGGTPEGFVSALYEHELLLDRAPEEDGQEYWVCRLSSNDCGPQLNRYRLARRFLALPEPATATARLAYELVGEEDPAGSQVTTAAKRYRSRGSDLWLLVGDLLAARAPSGNG